MTRRYTVGGSIPNFGPPFAVLDNAQCCAIALCWTNEQAQRICDALNGTLPNCTCDTDPCCPEHGRRAR
ncbi:MAG TPA: hypothetical protein VGI10_01380 [Polyangiaceae bacterium]|jgi:hypothetical protein